MAQYQVQDAEVLVIGAGLAGLWAAIAARELVPHVILVDKGKVARSGASVFCHSTHAPLPEGQYDSWMSEVVDRSTYLANQDLVQIFLQENNKLIKRMIDWGVEFEREKDGSLKVEGIRGQKITSSALYSGRQMMERMREIALTKGVEFRERVMITDLLTSDGAYPTRGQAIGAVGLNTRSGEFMAFRSKAVIIATGHTGIKVNTTYSNGLCGDGLSIAFRAGAELAGMEFQSPNFGFWNRKFPTAGQQQFLMHQAKIVNRLGERFMERYMASAGLMNPEYDGQVEFGDICRAIAIENLEGRGPCYFDLRGWSQENIRKMYKVLPVTMKALDDSGIDVSRDLIESTPIFAGGIGSHNSSGLIIDNNFQSTVKGLLVAGISAFAGGGVSPQGFCNVSGYRAGLTAARLASESDFISPSASQIEQLQRESTGPLKRETDVNPDKMYLSLQKTLVPYGASFFKNENRIRAVLKGLESFSQELPHLSASDAHELIKANEFRNCLQVMNMLYTAAMERKESRFGHYREEYPYRDDREWLKWVILKSDGKDGILVRLERVPFDKYPLKPPVLRHIPSFTRYTLK